MAAAPTTSSKDYKKTFDEVGYVIIPDLIPAGSRAELEAATERVEGWESQRQLGKKPNAESEFASCHRVRP